MLDHPSQATLSRSKALRDLGLSRLRVQDAHRDAQNNFDLLDSCNATPSRCFPGTRASNTTFDTSRADAGQSGSLDFSPGEIGELPSNLVSPLTPPSISAAELECLLGNASGKLKTGSTVQNRDIFSRLETDDPTSPKRPANPTTLERAKVRPRVELDIQLAGDTFVQGQCISGHLVVHVRSHRRADTQVLLANNTLRVIGFEYSTDSPTFHVFYHFSQRFEDLSYAGEQIFSESPDYSDEEGYREAKEGLHVLPFEMGLPMDSRFGKPKGVIDVPGGVAMRYIIMASIDIKEPDTNRLSVAHFYRQCSIWPGLSLRELLAPSTRPLVSTAVFSVPQGGSYSKLRLVARVPRPSYFAGQSCYVHIQIANNTQRTVRSLCMTLVRTTTIYRPRSGRRNRGGKTDEYIANKYTVKTVIEDISESRLVMAERTTRRAASSRGWWTGVNPDEKTAFAHRILVPPDAISVARSKLLAVDHAIRVTVYASAGMLGLTTHLSVTLPIRIVSMLSVDPPTSVASPGDMIGATHNRDGGLNGSSGEPRSHRSELENHTDPPPTYRTRPPSLQRPQNTIVSSRYAYLEHRL
ncbi:hypothetical protein EDB86DRAFT_2130583 [Lactarius hatsudake]|nr:hypothetical protein EDB86DRAFT_2130583 [Lactarius hatsudake]